MAAGLLVVVLMAASGAAPGSAGAEQGFCAKPALPVGEVPPPFKALLAIDRKKVGPGAKLRVRIENYGTEAVAYGYPYGLERWVQGEWVPQPTGPFLLPRFYVQPGTASRCQVIEMAKDAVDGTYRISKYVSPADPGGEPGRRVLLRTTFRVR